MVARLSSKSNGATPRGAAPPRMKGGVAAYRDSLENLITGLGTARDKTTATQFVFIEMGKSQVEAAYRSDWIARKIIDIPAQDATRQWRNWHSDQKDIEDLEDLERTLNVANKVQMAMRKARLYGGAAILIGVNQGSISKELDVEKVGKDALKFLHVVSRYELTAGETDWNIDSEYYGQPSYYRRANMNTTGSISLDETIHPSRVVRFIGNEVPDITLTTGWGDSVMQTITEAIIASGMASAAGAKIIQELMLDVIKIPELSESLSDPDYEARLASRFAAANLAKSLYNVLLLDSEEEWERMSATLTGVPDVVKQYLAIAAAAADIPATRLLGQSPQGMNATGDSDMRNYYDRIKAEQRTVLSPALSILDEVLIRSALGTGDPASVTYDWGSLWQLDDVQGATVAVQKSTVFKADHDAGLIPPEILRDARINQLIEDETYPGLEQIIDDYGPLDPIVQATPGSIIGPDGQPIPADDPRHPLHPAQQGAANQNDPNAVPPKAKGAAPPSVQKTRARAGGKAADQMADRARLMRPKHRRWAYSEDAIARTLYVSRPVLNARDLVAWARSAGIANITPAAEMHVTICYSRTPVDWTKTGSPSGYGEDENGNLTIRPGGMRMLDRFNDAIVLLFNCSDLSYRHCSINERCGGTWDYEDYQPHVTLSYQADDIGSTELLDMGAYQGEIILGPEIYAEATRGVLTDYNEYHDPDGKFSSGEGGGAPQPDPKHVTGAFGRAKQFLSSPRADKIISQAIGKVTDKEAQKEAMSRAIMFGLYHGAGIDVPNDVEEHLREQIREFAHNAKMTNKLAAEKIQGVVAKLAQSRLGARVGGTSIGQKLAAFARADAADDVYEMLTKLAALLAQMASTITDMNENHDPHSGQFTTGEGGFAIGPSAEEGHSTQEWAAHLQEMSGKGKGAAFERAFAGVKLYVDPEQQKTIAKQFSGKSAKTGREAMAVIRAHYMKIAANDANPNHAPAGSPAGGQFTSADYPMPDKETQAAYDHPEEGSAQLVKVKGGFELNTEKYQVHRTTEKEMREYLHKNGWAHVGFERAQ